MPFLGNFQVKQQDLFLFKLLCIEVSKKLERLFAQRMQFDNTLTVIIIMHCLGFAIDVNIISHYSLS